MKCPAFFKLFLSEFNNKDMKIPKAFIKCMEEALPEKVYLRDRYDNIWITNVVQVGEDIHFIGGWAKFVEDNLLESGDLLVFEYVSKASFHVKIYGPHATEKKDHRQLTYKGNNMQAFEECNNDNNYNGDEEEEETESDYYDYSLKSGDDVERNENDGEDEETDINSYDPNRHQEHEHEETYPNIKTGDSSRSKPKKLMPSCAQRYGVDIFKAGLAEQPRNPYFVTTVMQKRKGNLFIPREVIKYNKLDLTKEMYLMDHKGRKFRTKCRQWKDGRMVVSEGWRSLCNVNLVQKDDKCICEFLQPKGHPLLLSVRFIPADKLLN